MTAFYNDNDRFAVRWLKQLRKSGLITKGIIDDRSIKEIAASDLDAHERVHFFAGIGGWDLALQWAGWPDDESVWTASCPCQPFSNAGQRRGEDDERHLWPVLRDLVAECRPPVIFGEQVASKAGRDWLAGVRSDLEALGYAVGAADLCAAGVGAPHIRQRLWWVADADSGQRIRLANGEGRERDGAPTGRVESDGQLERGGEAGELAHPLGAGMEGRSGVAGELQAERQRAAVERSGEAGWMADPMRPGRPQGRAGSGLGSSAWSGGAFISCADGKARRIGPGVFPLAHGVSARVGRLRGYGNAIVPLLAATFIRSYMECRA